MRFLIWDCPKQFRPCGRVMWSELKSLIINHLEKKNMCVYCQRSLRVKTCFKSRTGAISIPQTSSGLAWKLALLLNLKHQI